MNNIILGAGITGLSAGISSGFQIYESENFPGGICASYYLKPEGGTKHHKTQADEENYRFEIGGGHWIFGIDALLLSFLETFTTFKRYERQSSVYFPERKKYIPYPIQNHLSYFENSKATQILDEIAARSRQDALTMDKWILQNFGPTLSEEFFFPFHKLYTAGLYQRIAPQDAYKSPIDLKAVIRGALDQPRAVGYNTEFIYPTRGLNVLTEKMADHCNIHFNKNAVEIDTEQKKVIFSDGTAEQYDKLISTIPLSKILELSKSKLSGTDPHTSVLVLNIGADKGINYPSDNWLYIPQCDSGFHRVGFYSNVDPSFLPKSDRVKKRKCSLYIERAFSPDKKPSADEIENYKLSVQHELQEWGFIESIDVIDATWIEFAYTWKWPHNNWREKAINELREKSIYQTGRYGKWKFQGIADSIKEGLLVGTFLKYL